MSDVNYDDLERGHKELLQSYVKFFNVSLRENSSEVQASFDSIKDMRLLDDMYSKAEMESVLDSLRTSVVDTFTTEVDKYKHQSVLFLYLLFKQAEENSTSLKIAINL